MKILCVLILIFTLTASQEIQIGKEYVFDVNLTGKTWHMTRPKTWNNLDLFFQFENQIFDPFQFPTFIFSSNNFTLICDKKNPQYKGICKVSANIIKEAFEWQVTLQCLKNCRINFQSYLSSALLLSLGQILDYKSGIFSRQNIQIKIEIPYNIAYNEIVLQVTYNQRNTTQNTEGVTLFANVGDENVTFPNQKNIQFTASPFYHNGINIILADAKPGQFIAISLEVPANWYITFKTILKTNILSYINLYSNYYDFSIPNKSSIYLLNLTDIKILDQNIVFSLIVFSGTPQIRLFFQSEFLRPLPSHFTKGNVDYFLTSSLRKNYNYRGLVYIVIQSNDNAQYQLYVELQTGNYQWIFQGRSAFNSLNFNGVQNYFFSFNQKISSQKTKQIYEIKIINNNRQILKKIQRCLSYEKNYSTTPCLYSNCQELKSTTSPANENIQPITLNQQEQNKNTLFMSFEYNITKCPILFYDNKTEKEYFCVFQIGICNNNAEQVPLRTKLTRKSYTSQLQAGVPIKGIVEENQYVYFKFMITNLTDVNSVSFYITTSEGNVFLLCSKSIQYPYLVKTLEPTNINIFATRNNKFVFDETQLSNVFYLSVYGVQYTSFTLVTVVQQKLATSIELLIDSPQEYTLNNDEVTFVIKAQAKKHYTIKVNELNGAVSMKLYNEKNDALNCSLITICQLQSQKNTLYSVTIKRQNANIAHFVITFSQTLNCAEYLINTPLLVTSKTAMSNCIVFKIKKIKNLEVATSLTTMQLLSVSANISWCLKNKCTLLNSQRAFIYSTQLIDSCPLTKNSSIFFASPCSIILWLNISTQIDFNIIIQDTKAPKSLFDGNIEYISIFKQNSLQGKLFYYKVDSKSDIKIFIKYTGWNQLKFLAHFAQIDSSENNFYIKNQNASGDNVYSMNIKYHQITKLRISKEQIIKNCKNCFLTIWIFCPKTFYQVNFEIEVTQKQTILYEGTTKSITLAQNQSYIYYITIKNKSLLTVRDINQESDQQDICFDALISFQTNEQHLQNEFYKFQQQSQFKDYQLILISKNNDCSVQVSLISFQYNLTEITLNTPHQINILNNETIFFYFSSFSKETISVYQFITSGSCKFFALSFSKKQSLSSQLRKNISEYPFQGGEQGFKISQQKYEKCNYLIAVQGKPSFKGQIVVQEGHNPIALRTTGVLKSFIQNNETNCYVYESIDAFNLTINAFIGNLTINIQFPDRSVKQTFTGKQNKIIFQPLANVSLYNPWEAYKYLINVTTQNSNKYFIKINTYKNAIRIFQTVPSLLSFQKNQIITLQFVNLDESTKEGEIISVLINLKYCYNGNQSIDCQKVNLTLIKNQIQQDNRTIQIFTNATRIENSFNYKMQRIKGTYFIQISASITLYGQALLIQSQLTHLAPLTTYLFDQQSVLQLYSTNQNSIFIEVQNCVGSLVLQATNDLQKIKNSSLANQNVIMLEQANYGGHYLMTVQRQYGQYFVRAMNAFPGTPLQYTVRYIYYKDDPPFKQVSLIDSQIQYSFSSTAVIFYLPSPYFAPTKKFQKIVYTLFMSTSRQSISQYAKCSIGNVTQFRNSSFQSRTFVVSQENISAIGVPVIFIGASVEITFAETVVQLSYSTIQIYSEKKLFSQSTQQINNAKDIILKVVLPILLFVLICLSALVFLVRRYYKTRLFYGQELVEEAKNQIDL